MADYIHYTVGIMPTAADVPGLSNTSGVCCLELYNLTASAGTKINKINDIKGQPSICNAQIYMEIEEHYHKKQY